MGGNNFSHLRSVRIPKGGFVNAMRWTEKGDKLVIGMGREHRLGRWETVSGARNGIVVLKLPIQLDGVEGREVSEDEDEEEEKAEGSMVFEEAEEWDKWNPKERGEAEKEKVKEDEKGG